MRQGAGTLVIHSGGVAGSDFQAIGGTPRAERTMHVVDLSGHQVKRRAPVSGVFDFGCLLALPAAPPFWSFVFSDHLLNPRA